MFASLTSAAAISEWNLTVDGSAINVNSDVTAGTFGSSGVTFNSFGANGANAEGWPTGASSVVDTSKYFEVTISPKTGNTLTITNINFDYSASIEGPAKFEAKYSKQASFASPTSLVIKEDVSSGTAKSSSNSGLTLSVSSGETLTLRWFGYSFTAATNEFRVKDLAILGTVASDAEDPTEIKDCATVGNPNTDLTIEIEGIKVMKGFGDDEEFWYPLDSIEVEIKAENNNQDEDMRDVEIEWGLYDVEAEKWVFDEKESDFNLKDDSDKTIFVEFDLDDVDEFDNNDYVFYVWANGELKDDAKTKICASDSEEIEIVNSDDFVVLADIESPETASCGSEIQITADVWNVGDNDQDEVKVVIFNKELGINEVIEMGEIKDFDNEVLDTFVEIPSDVEEKIYALSLKVFDEDNDIYETDEDNDESEFIIRIDITGCSVSSTALVSANLESGGKAGEDLVVKSTIANTGTSSVTYTVNAAGYAEWASSASADQSTFTLGVGESKDVLFTLDVKEDASGENQFNIEVLSENSLVATQPVQVEIQESGSGFGVAGNLFSDGNKYLWGIGILNVILIIVIIIVAIKVARK